jgi:shikimate dehydrogenase
MDEVTYISERSRLFGIVGHPIEQVRSPEMVTAEFVSRGLDAILLPIHIQPDNFDNCIKQLKCIENLDGLIFTIPFKQMALSHSDHLGVQAKNVGAINALARRDKGQWSGDIFDGIGCVEAFRRRGYSFKDQRVMLTGAGGAGSAIAIAVAHEAPRSMRLFDPDASRVSDLIAKIAAINPSISTIAGDPSLDQIDIFLNASPVGMLGDTRMPIEVSGILPEVIVFDAIVKPEKTKLLAIAEQSGCRTVYGREMMRGQITKIVDFFLNIGG